MLRRRCVSLLHHVRSGYQWLAHATKPLFVTISIGLVVCRVPHQSQSPVGLVELAASLRVGPLAIRKGNVAWCREILPRTTRRNVCAKTTKAAMKYGVHAQLSCSAPLSRCLGNLVGDSCHRWTVACPDTLETNTTLPDVRTGARGSFSEKIHNSGT